MCNRKETKDREGIKCAQRQSRCTKRERERAGEKSEGEEVYNAKYLYEDTDVE
jgi:hypothetical protein